MFVILGLITGVTTSTARAQSVTSFGDLPLRLNLGDRLTVADIGAATWRGRLTRITLEELVLRTDSGEVALARDRVQQVRACCDSLRNGTLIGAGAGATIGVLFARGFSDHPSAGDDTTGAMIFGAIGAGLGVGFDALIRGDVVVYRAPALSVTVVADPKRHGLHVVMRW